MSFNIIDAIMIFKLIDIVIENKIFLNNISYSYCILIVFEMVRNIINKNYETDISNKIKFILSNISLFLNEYYLLDYLLEKISNKYDLI
jgi:hypothetical protein